MSVAREKRESYRLQLVAFFFCLKKRRVASLQGAYCRLFKKRRVAFLQGADYRLREEKQSFEVFICYMYRIVPSDIYAGS